MRRAPRLEVICVGTELLTGKVNTHTSYLGQRLPELGLSIAREHAVGDDPKIMREVFSEAFERADIVLCAGGLGPTFDDITRDVWSQVLKRKLITDPALIVDIREKFKARGIPMPPMNRRQAQVLKGASVIPNPNGTAPGQYWSQQKKVVVLLPGPARELYPMFEDFVRPRLRAAFPPRFSLQKSFHAVGVPESKIDAIIRPLVLKWNRIGNCNVIHGILASQSIITVKFQVEGEDETAVRRATEKLTNAVRKKISDYVFGEDNDTLERVTTQLLADRRWTLATAESCTGGLIAKLITDVPGSSKFFLEGIVTYSNRSKMKRLGVRSSTLDKYGAVSEQTAKEMAHGARRTSGADAALSVTGVAGPDGGTADKPVGLVYIGCSTPRRTLVHRFQFTGDRSWIRHRSALMALNILRRELLNSARA